MNVTQPRISASDHAQAREHANLRTQAREALLSLQAEAGRERDVYLTFPVPTPGSAEALLELDEQAVYWRNRDGELFVGLGAVRTFAATPSDRCLALSAAAPRLAACVTGGILGAPNERVRCFGGLAFQPGRARSEPWRAFGDGGFHVPRLSLRVQGGAWLMSLFIRNDEFDSTETHLATALALAAALPSLETAPGQAASAALSADADEPRFTQLVQDILRRIQDGNCSKVVAALCVKLAFPRRLSIASTLAELTRARLSTTFAFKRGSFTFCGSTPERLIRKHQLQLSTEAMAGTFKRADSFDGRALLSSTKEQDEHQPVLEAIVAALAPMCVDLNYPAQPEICELPDLLHLKTPITGTLREPSHILTLVKALHPTPAVGGVPKETAMAVIAQEESAERGWYAGPIGWFDSDGDGEFCVALRAGVLNANRAFLFAGAGIVAGSEPRAEFAETQLKLRNLRASLRY